MNKLIVLLLVIAAVFYFTSNSATTITDEDYTNKNLSELKMELESKENMLNKMEAHFDKLINNARPKCDGGTVQVTVDETPMIELREEIEDLRERIYELEEE